VPDSVEGSTGAAPDPDGTQGVGRDTERHDSARISGGDGCTKHDTAVFKFRDPRAARPRIYRAFEGLPWAIADLAKKMNYLIDRGELEGTALVPGDIVQVAVVSYFHDGQVHKPQTKDGSPGLATLPYRIAFAPGGYWTAQPAVPPETLVHFRLPETVGELIPNLPAESAGQTFISLQLKEATYASDQAVLDEAQRVLTATGEFETVDGSEEDASGFRQFAEKAGAGGPVCDEWRDFTMHLDDVARDEHPEQPARKKLSERLKNVETDFGFGKVE
jgi:hypothetical protein